MSITDFRFRQYLNSTYINKVKQDFGFIDDRIIEQFIMDFEMLYHIQGLIPNLVIKGGMSVPFHIQKDVRRLSQDIDLVTPLSKAEVESVMAELGARANGLFTIPSPHKPKNPTKSLPLLTYHVPFRSNIGTPDPQVKIEFFYDFKEDISTKQIEPGTELIDFKLDYPIRVFDKGSLIGDKITTLGFETIGIPLDRRSEIVKHIYDIASIIKEIHDKPTIEEIGTIYDKIVNYENSLMGNKFTKQEIIKDILNSLDSLLTQNSGYSLGTFAQMTVLEFTDGFFDDLRILNKILSQSGAENKITRREIVASFDTRANGDFINKLPQTEQVFLYSKIAELKR